MDGESSWQWSSLKTNYFSHKLRHMTSRGQQASTKAFIYIFQLNTCGTLPVCNVWFDSCAKSGQVLEMIPGLKFTLSRFQSPWTYSRSHWEGSLSAFQEDFRAFWSIWNELFCWSTELRNTQMETLKVFDMHSEICSEEERDWWRTLWRETQSVCWERVKTPERNRGVRKKVAMKRLSVSLCLLFNVMFGTVELWTEYLFNE